MMSDLIDRQDALSCFHDWIDQRGDVHTADEMPEYQRIEQLPSVQPELIEKTAYIRGFEQGRTQGMIDSQGGKK